jgi:hypothetical protein
MSDRQATTPALPDRGFAEGNKDLFTKRGVLHSKSSAMRATNVYVPKWWVVGSWPRGWNWRPRAVELVEHDKNVTTTRDIMTFSVISAVGTDRTEIGIGERPMRN